MAEHYIYILLSKVAPKTYTGVTFDVEKRLSEHNNGCNGYSRKYKPWELFHKEIFKTKKEALQREKYLKSSAGRKFVRSLFKNDN